MTSRSCVNSQQAISTAFHSDSTPTKGWTVKESLRFLTELEKLPLDVEFVEQPVRADDIAGLRFVRERSPYPILADEAVHGPADAARILAEGAADMLNIKLAKSGGIAAAFELAAIAKSFNTPCVVGCMMESPVGVAAAAHFAIAAGIRAVDLDPIDWVDAATFATWLDFSAPTSRLRELPGIGFQRV